MCLQVLPLFNLGSLFPLASLSPLSGKIQSPAMFFLVYFISVVLFHSFFLFCNLHSSSGPMVTHHPTPMVATSNHSTPGLASGPSSVPVLLTNSSGNTLSVTTGGVPHHASAPVHHPYPQGTVTPAAPPPGNTVPHGVNSVSSTSGAQVSILSVPV